MNGGEKPSGINLGSVKYLNSLGQLDPGNYRVTFPQHSILADQTCAGNPLRVPVSADPLPHNL